MNDIDAQRERIAGWLHEPTTLTFPEGWTLSTSWKRAQSADGVVGSVNPVEWDVLLDDGDRHRVMFTVYGGDVRAECDCDGYHYRGWCAHVARLWWRWVRRDLDVADLDTGRTYLSPPWWLEIDDDTDRSEVSAESTRTARADGGEVDQ